MSFAIHRPTPAVAGVDSEKISIDRYWCLTEDRTRVVPETDPQARWLYWRPGDQVLRAEAERLGAVGTQRPEVKMLERPPDKAMTKPVDKAAAGRPDPKTVREWAAAAGVDVAERGRIPDDVMDDYLQAHREV